MKCTACVFTAIAIVSMSYGLAAAESAPIAPGKVEVAGYGGFLSGVSDFSNISVDVPGVSTNIQSSGSKWNVGGGVGVALNRYLIFNGDLIREKFGDFDVTAFSQGRSATAGVSMNITSFTGGLQAVIPLPSSRFSPYGTVGETSFSDTGTTVYYGGGVRFFITDRLGFRPEVRVVRALGETYIRTTVGVFYQFR